MSEPLRSEAISIKQDLRDLSKDQSNSNLNQDLFGRKITTKWQKLHT